MSVRQLQTQQVPLSAVDISVLNTRKDLDAGGEDSSLDDLAKSIAEQGLISPPVLRPIGAGRYEVIAGQRRVLACRKLNLENIPALVRNDLSDKQALAISLIENVQRADMSPMDKARAYEGLKEQYGTVPAVSRSTGVSESTIRKYLTLLRLPLELQKLVITGAGPTGVGLMSQLATTFEHPETMIEAWDLVKDFKSDLAQRLIKDSGGDLDKLHSLRGRAIEGAFDVLFAKPCGINLETCPHVPDNLRPAIRELLLRSEAGEF